MKILVTGSRGWTNRSLIANELLSREPTMVVEGGAKGADRITRQIAEDNGIEVREYPADWGTHRKAAGVIRNQQMLEEESPDLVLAFWDGESPGTLHMINLAREWEFHTIVITEKSLTGHTEYNA